MAVSIKELESKLSTLVAVPQVKPDRADINIPSNWRDGIAKATGTMDTIERLLDVLYGAGGVGASVATVGKDIGTALGDVRTALIKIADHLDSIVSTGEDIHGTLTTLQNALATAEALVPGSSPALSSGSKFFGQLADLLGPTNDAKVATITLYKIAQQLQVIADKVKAEP